MIKLQIAGSPCTHWSIARQEGRETEAEGIGWELFKNYLIAKEKFQPDFFLYENNESASKQIKQQIENELGHKRITINSNLLSAQNRKRFYVTNGEIEQPNDRKIELKDIVESDVWPELVTRPRFKETKCRRYSIKSPTITANGGGEHIPRAIYKKYDLNEITRDNYKERSRELTSLEVERLQTMPDGYTEGIRDTKRKNCLGNGWTAEVIIHILSQLLKDVQKDEEIIVLSLYDGIATGRYCLEKMGFTNVKYYAYEIEKNAIEIAKKNYPDIIEMGDAFEVRNNDWSIEGIKTITA